MGANRRARILTPITCSMLLLWDYFQFATTLSQSDVGGMALMLFFSVSSSIASCLQIHHDEYEDTVDVWGEHEEERATSESREHSNDE